MAPQTGRDLPRRDIRWWADELAKLRGQWHDCGMHVVMWDRGDESGNSAAGFRVTLDPRQVVHIDTAQNKSLGLQCGSAADTLAVVETGKIYTAGAAE